MVMVHSQNIGNVLNAPELYTLKWSNDEFNVI